MFICMILSIFLYNDIPPFRQRVREGESKPLSKVFGYRKERDKMMANLEERALKLLTIYSEDKCLRLNYISILKTIFIHLREKK